MSSSQRDNYESLSKPRGECLHVVAAPCKRNDVWHRQSNAASSSNTERVVCLLAQLPSSDDVYSKCSSKLQSFDYPLTIYVFVTDCAHCLAPGRLGRLLAAPPDAMGRGRQRLELLYSMCYTNRENRHVNKRSSLWVKSSYKPLAIRNNYFEMTHLNANSMTTSPRALALPPAPTSPVILSPDAIKAMTTKDVAQVAVARAGIQSELCLGALIGRIHGRTFEGDWSRENLSRELAHVPYFILHPSDLELIIETLVGMKNTAASHAAAAGRVGVARCAPAERATKVCVGGIMFDSSCRQIKLTGRRVAEADMKLLSRTIREGMFYRLRKLDLVTIIRCTPFFLFSFASDKGCSLRFV